MKDKLHHKDRIILFVMGVMAIGFGVMTIKSGSFALFGGKAGKEFAGNYVPFVLWFNFIAGFFYVFSGLGIFLKKRWGVTLAKGLALLTPLVFIAFVIAILMGVEYEMRTVGAMSVRSIFWIVVFLLSRQHFNIKTT